MTDRLSQVCAALISLSALVTGASTAQTPPTAHARAAHAVSRLTFGPRHGDVDRVVAMGLDRWIDQQLHPETMVDTGAIRALAGCPTWTDAVASAVAALSGPIVIKQPSATGDARTMRVFVIGSFLRIVTRDSVRRAGEFGDVYRQNNQLFACRLTRAEASDQQLLEVMTDFWENHFSVYGDKLPSRGSLVEFDRAVIRPRALGKCRDLLGAVARSPAMLHYLDNALNTAGGVNENYGRELLELHTLGAAGGFSQADVIDVARALTGWTHTWIRSNGTSAVLGRPAADPAPPAFVFDSTRHDMGAKLVLGTRLPAGRGIDDGNDVLDVLARHPSTARFIARKLVVRFVSDAPPTALVDRAAETFLRTDGDIREVVRSIVTSPEFFADDAIGSKVKSPVELVLSTRRALGAPVDTAGEMIDLLIALEQLPFGRLTPEGWPDVGSTWLGVGAMRARLELAARIASGAQPSIPVEAWPAWSTLSTETFDRQLADVTRLLLNGRVSQQNAIGARRRAPIARHRR